MRLAEFVAKNSDAILAEWVTFATSCVPAADQMGLQALRDHAEEMLQAIVADLHTPQTSAEQAQKSKGHATRGRSIIDTAAHEHGAARAESGFTIGQIVAEYRALRASVIRLWAEANGGLGARDVSDLIRFSEAIDEALAESVQRFAAHVDYTKDMVVAILGHDLRTPLGAVITSSQFLLDTGELAEPHLTLTKILVRSARRMNQLVVDLLDLTRSRLGSALPVVRREMDLGSVARHVVEEMAAAEPSRVLQFESSGDVRGEWDPARMSQVLANLLANAVQHGSATTPVRVAVHGEDASVLLCVHNYGPAISASDLPRLFNPLKRLASGERGGRNLGLGLYIAERIVFAHGGTIDVQSSPHAGTLFTVRLPR